MLQADGFPEIVIFVMKFDIILQTSCKINLLAGKLEGNISGHTIN